MSNEDIIAIIKWGPILLFLLIFLFGMLRGMIKGRRKTVRRFIYVAIYVTLIFIFTPKITELLLGLEVKGVSVEGYINDFINNNETMKGLFEEIPGLQSLVETYPSAIISLILFIVLVFVGLPLSFPIYFIYMAIYALISRYVFKYSRYKRDENGKILRNEKGKKIKDKKNKHRLTGGLIKGVEGVALTSTVLIPVGVISRLYKTANETSSSGTIANIEYLQNYQDILNYLDAFNDSAIGKVTNSNVNKNLAGYLTPITVEDTTTTLENELDNVVVAAIYLNESGIISLLSNGVDLATLDLSTLNLNKLDLAIEALFNSSTLKSIISDGVNYVLEHNLKDTLVQYTNNENIVSELKYSNASEVKQELLGVVSVLKEVINSRLLTIYQNNGSNYVGIINQVNTSDVETLLNKILSIKILSKSMPYIVENLLKNYGLTSELTTENNSEFTKIIVDAVKLVKSVEIVSMEDVTSGNMLDNLVNILYQDGTIKSNTKNALATLLTDIASSNVFNEVLVTQLNKLLDKYELTLNSQMIMNVKTSEDWNKELVVLGNIFELYDDYQKENKVDFLKATNLLTNLKNTKAMILSLPIAYEKFFPKLGIEVDPDKLTYIDYDSDSATQDEIEFYTYWREQLTHLENISEELAKLRITSISDLSLDLLDIKENVTSIATIMGEVFSADLLKDGVEGVLNENISKLLVDYGVTLNDTAISDVNNTIKTTPYYIEISNEEYEVNYSDNKYYINEEEVSLNEEEVIYNGTNYELKTNTLTRVWQNELDNLANIVSVIKLGNYTDKDNLTVILNSVDNMKLLASAKNDLLLYAVKQINILPSEDYDAIDKDLVSFTKEKEILLNIIDKYDVLSDLSNIDLETIDDETISDLSDILDNVLKSDIFGDYVANKLVDVSSSANINLTVALVKNANTWEADLKLMKKALNMNIDAFNSDSIEEILNGIEESSLLASLKEDLLLDTAKKIEISNITIDENLTGADLTYDDEKAAILAVAKNLDLVKTISSLDLDKVDTDAISEVLTATLKSKMFGNSVKDNLVSVFTSNDIKHDLDTSESNDHLKNVISNVDDWKVEFNTIKDLLNIDSKDKISSDIFDSIEDSKLLGGCKANLLLKMVSSINDDELTLVNVTTLTNDNYVQYGKEKDLLVAFADSTDIEDISSINSTNKQSMANVLNKMKESVIFDKKYTNIVSDIANPIKENETITNWGLEVDSNATVDNWNDELDSLLTMNDNVDAITAMDSSNFDTSVIGNTLDAIDNSRLLDGSQSIANNLIAKISNNNVDSINKDEDETWTEAFNKALGK